MIRFHDYRAVLTGAISMFLIVAAAAAEKAEPAITSEAATFEVSIVAKGLDIPRSGVRPPDGPPYLKLEFTITGFFKLA